MTILLEDQWFDLGCGCEASTLGGLIVKVTCPRHGPLVPEADRRAMTGARASYGLTYGPMDVDLKTLAGEGERRRASTRHRGHRPTNR